MPDTPHFAIPFRRTPDGKSVVVTEQDSIDEVGDCVFALLTTPLGARLDLPEFGVLDQTFQEGGVDLNEIQSAIAQWEERADVLIDQQPDLLDKWVERVTVTVSGRDDG
jgi:phage baseplate assembly protein W